MIEGKLRDLATDIDTKNVLEYSAPVLCGWYVDILHTLSIYHISILII
jgi:hypothetical protein